VRELNRRVGHKRAQAIILRRACRDARLMQPADGNSTLIGGADS
jgi:hypothetical protein